jgi:multiple sugar transport system permease protein
VTDPSKTLPRPAAAPSIRNRWSERRRRLAPIILLAPGCLLFTVFVVYPILDNIRLSFFDWNGSGPQVFVGLDNYLQLAADPVFHIALRNNLIWLALFLLLAPALGLFLAIFLSQSLRGIRLVRALFFMPFVISQVVVGLIFAWFLNSQFGLLDQLLQALRLSPIAPLESERWAIVAVVLAALWPQTAYCMMLYLTGLAGLQREPIEAARLYGAKGVSLLWRIVLPQLRPVTFIVCLVCIVSALRSFDLVMIITRGGPFNSSIVLAYYMYEQTFLASRYGYAAAIAVVLLLMMGFCIAIFLRRLLRLEPV